MILICSSSRTGKIDIVNMSILPNANYRLNTILIKIPTEFSSKTWKEQFSTSYGKTKKLRIGKTFFNNKTLFQTFLTYFKKKSLIILNDTDILLGAKTKFFIIIQVKKMTTKS